MTTTIKCYGNTGSILTHFEEYRGMRYDIQPAEMGNVLLLQFKGFSLEPMLSQSMELAADGFNYHFFNNTASYCYEIHATGSMSYAYYLRTRSNQ